MPGLIRPAPAAGGSSAWCRPRRRPGLSAVPAAPSRRAPTGCAPRIGQRGWPVDSIVAASMLTSDHRLSAPGLVQQGAVGGGVVCWCATWWVCRVTAYALGGFSAMNQPPSASEAAAAGASRRTWPGWVTGLRARSVTIAPADGRSNSRLARATSMGAWVVQKLSDASVVRPCGGCCPRRGRGAGRT